MSQVSHCHLVFVHGVSVKGSESELVFWGVGSSFAHQICTLSSVCLLLSHSSFSRLSLNSDDFQSVIHLL